MREKVLVFGGLGNPDHSIISLYAPLLRKLQDKYDIIAIDPLEKERSERIRNIGRGLGLHYYKDTTPDVFFSSLKNQDDYRIKAVFILTPVVFHLEILEGFTKADKRDNILFVVEKPSFALDESERGFGVTVNNLKERGNQLYFIDTAMISPSINKVIEEGLLEKMGSIQKIIAIAVDNPTKRSEKLSEYTFNNKITALNSRKLLELNKSGGAGFGFDMGIHAAAGLMRLLDSIGICEGDMRIKDVRLEALCEDRLIRDRGAETYLLIKGETSQNIEIIVEGGKGTDIWDRRLEIYGEEGTIIVGLGTLAHKPYIRIIESGVDEIFDVADTSYSLHFNDIIKILERDQKEGIILSPELNERLMKDSMRFIKNAYFSIDPDTSKREEKISKVESHNNSLLNEREREIRQEMETFLESIL